MAKKLAARLIFVYYDNADIVSPYLDPSCSELNDLVYLDAAYRAGVIVWVKVNQLPSEDLLGFWLHVNVVGEFCVFVL